MDMFGGTVSRHIMSDFDYFISEVGGYALVMMQESKLTNYQQRQITAHLQNGDTLPVVCHPSSSSGQHTPSTSESTPKKKIITNARSGLRPAEKCRAGSAYSREKFQPQPTRDLNKEKRRLQNIMATGKDLPDIPKAPPEIETETEEKDRFDELVAEIQERWDFLNEMEALGQGRKYYNIINTEISQKLREMEIIDKHKCTELKEALQKSENKKAALSQ
ncbi:UPF0193 protein EVG1 [Pyxicephalus adspersus]